MSAVAKRLDVLVILGWACVALGVVANHWLLAAVLSPDGDLGLRSKTIIWLGQGAFFGVGAYLIWKARRVERPIGWLKEKYVQFAIVVLNTLGLFVILNLVALFFTAGGRKPSDTQRLGLYYSPGELYADNRAVLRRLYEGYSDAEIREIIDTPPSGSHPTLEYTSSPVRSRFYNVGVEGIRYDHRVTDENALELINGSTWVMGGSTVYGWGLPDDETIVAYLNRLDPENTYLNFGVAQYGQNQEIEKLVHLIRKGYRPARVLFLDGWNDLAMMRATRFHPVETPAKKQLAYPAAANVDTMRQTGWKDALRQIPLLKLVQSRADAGAVARLEPLDGTRAYEAIYVPGSLYHAKPFLHYDLTTEQAFDFDSIMENIAFYQEKLALGYTRNAAFLEGLAEAFGFEWHVFLQPLGSRTDKNPFLKSKASFGKHGYFRYTGAMWDHIRGMVERGELIHFHDISETDIEAGLEGEYTDACHYSATLSEEVARRMIAVMQVARNGER